jgi:YegS/Rv2252/BmrU family lipid kinase
MELTMKRLLFLYNPNAGKGKIKSVLSDIVEMFVNADYEVTIHSTKCREDAMKVSRQKGEEYDIIVASGGDGTLSEVINGIMPLNRRPQIGFIPTGTTNDFAMNFKISKFGISAAQSVVIGKPFPYDIGEFNGKYFHYVASFGLFASVSYSTDQAFKNVMGRTAYVLEGAKSLANIKTYNLKINYDNNIIEDKIIFGMISNAHSVGGFKSITGKDVSLNDGLFEVMMVKMPENLFELQQIINSLLLSDMRNNSIYKFKASKISIECDEDIEWTLDGEFGGKVNNVDIINHKGAIDFLVDESVIVEIADKNDTNETFYDVDTPYMLDEVSEDVFRSITRQIDLDE